MIWPFTRRLNRKTPKSVGTAARRPRRFVPSVELLEERALLTAGAFLQGTAFIDANQNNVLDPGEAYLPNATVRLYAGPGFATQVGQTTTDANGGYLFDDSNVTGGLNPGTYRLVETPPAGYTNQGVQILSDLDPASAVDARTIQVTVVDPSNLSITFDSNAFFARNKWDYIDFIFNPNNVNPPPHQQSTIGQFPVTVNGTGLAPAPQFLSLCWDLAHSLTDGVNNFPVLPTSGQSSPANAGEIAYLFNHYGTQDLSKQDAAGLQVAIWELEYGSAFGSVSGILPYTDATETAAILSRAGFYVNDATGKSERATFLDARIGGPTAGRQGMIATGSLDFGNTPIATPSINTTQQPASATVGSSVADKATVSGGSNPTGTVTFKLYNNPNGTGTPLFTDTEALVNGMATSAGYTATATGTDYWVATYNGDSNNNPVTSGTALEPVSITPATPSINTTQQPASATVGSSIADKATVSGGFNPTGTVTFKLYNNPNGTGTPLFTDTEALVGGMATSAGYTATATGTDYWVATYNGDSKNNPVTSGTALEPVTITAASTPVSKGATATIGYWHNKNGQALVTSFNGSANSTALGNWLASNFGNLFGSFAGKTNTQVAAGFLTAFGNVGGVQGNTYVQTFAVALAVYATDPTLGGGSAATGQGFTVKAGGTGSDTFNVGSNGAAFGVSNNTSLSVFQILKTLNSNFDPATGLFYGGSQSLTSAANNVTNGINQGGDI
jgi:hypothetical protein